MKSRQLSSGSFGGSLDLLKASNVPGTSFSWVVMANSVDLVVCLARTGSSHGIRKDISCGCSMNGRMTDRSLLYDHLWESVVHAVTLPWKVPAVQLIFGLVAAKKGIPNSMSLAPSSTT